MCIYICTYSTWNASNSRNWEARRVTNFDRPSELNPNIQQTNDWSLRLPSDSLQKWTLKLSCPNIKSSNLQISHNFLISPAQRNAPRLRVSDLLRWTDWWALALHEALTQVAMFPSERGVEHADLEDGIFASVFLTIHWYPLQPYIPSAVFERCPGIIISVTDSYWFYVPTCLKASQ